MGGWVGGEVCVQGGSKREGRGREEVEEGGGVGGRDGGTEGGREGGYRVRRRMRRRDGAGGGGADWRARAGGSAGSNADAGGRCAAGGGPTLQRGGGGGLGALADLDFPLRRAAGTSARHAHLRGFPVFGRARGFATHGAKRWRKRVQAVEGLSNNEKPSIVIHN